MRCASVRNATSLVLCLAALGLILAGCGGQASGRRDIEGVPGGFTYGGSSSDNYELYELAADHLASGEFSQAEDLYRQLVELENGSADAQVGLGSSLFLQGRLGAAEQAYLAALGLQADSAAARVGLGSVYLQQAAFERAEDAYRAALRYEPGNPDALWGLALSLHALGQDVEALEKLERVRSLVPGTTLAENASNLIDSIHQE